MLGLLITNTLLCSLAYARATTPYHCNDPIIKADSISALKAKYEVCTGDCIKKRKGNKFGESITPKDLEAACPDGTKSNGEMIKMKDESEAKWRAKHNVKNECEWKNGKTKHSGYRPKCKRLKPNMPQALALMP